MEGQDARQPYDLTQRLLAFGELKAEGRSFAVVTSEELKARLQLSERQLVRLLTRLAAEGRIQRLQRTLYLLPGRLPPGKVWKPSVYEALASYMGWLGATWQITGLSAFARHGFSTQVAQKTSVYNDQISGEKVLAGNAVTFIKLPKSRLGFTCEDKLTNREPVIYSSRGRALFDAISDQKHFSCLPEAYMWLAESSHDKDTLNDFVTCSVAHGNIQSLARIGFVLEKLGVDATTVHDRFTALAGTKLVTLAPGPRRGPIAKRWNIIENIKVEDLFTNLEIADEDDE